MDLLIPDMKATKDVDLNVLNMLRTIANADFALEKDKEDAEAKEMRQVAELALENYSANGDSPTVVIGYIPPRKLTSLKHGAYINHRDGYDHKTATQEQMDAQTETAREWVRWGLRGLKNLGVEFESEKESCGPIEYDVATWGMVEVIEGIGLLDQVSMEVLKFNTLDESKKKKSS